MQSIYIGVPNKKQQKLFCLSAYEAKFFILYDRAFKMMKNSVYFIVIAPLVAELFKILIYAN